ncbi:hypothetical protein C2E23DRAFT_887728 [Lenzites betulinus]|nr:hypothetical protein C2E23DRAFT_887728 [Lenzites betulinus]
MRVCLASAARIFTLFSLALLSSQSFILANAQDTPGSTDVGSADVPDPSLPLSPSVTSPAATPTSVSTPSSSPPPSSSQKPTSSAQPAAPTSTSTKSSSSTAVASPTSADTEAASSTSAASTSAAAQSSSSSASTASSSSSDSASSSSSSSSSASSTSSSSSSLSPTGITLKPATVASSATTRHSSSGTDTTTYGWLSPSASATGAVADNVSASHNGFFDNTGAVAGTFSVVGVVVLGGIIVAVLYAKRRAARLQDEEDMTYFEKYNTGNGDSHDIPGDLSFGNDNPSDAEMMTHAAPDAYPDRSMHYGLPSMAEYAQPQPPVMSAYAQPPVMADYAQPQQPPAAAYGAAATGAGLDYPAGTAYARAQAQQGQQYQYEGYGATAYGAEYNNNSQYQDAYYEARRSPSSPTHPYADPRNSPRQEGAPPVGSNIDLVQGEAR